MIVQYFEKTHEIFVTPLHLHSNSQRVGDYSLIILHHSTNTRTGLLHFSIPGSPPRRNGCRFPLFWSEFPVSTIYHRSETRRISTTCLRIMKAINTLIAIVLLAVCQAVGSGFGCFEVSRSCFRCIFYQTILTDL